MENEIRYFSMFTGVGGFELGLERANYSQSKVEEYETKQDSSSNNFNELQRTTFSCVGFSEIDKYASQLLAAKFPEVKNYGDARKIEPSELPDFDMLCGGFPCQAFSIAGKRRGFEDTRGTLFFEIARILEVKRPRLVFLENVKGLLNHNKGETFSVIIQTLEELGYRTQWMVLNSKFFGVPQNRERVFIVGSLGGEPRPEILPFRKTDELIDERISETETASSLQHPGHSGGNYRGMNMISKTIRKGRSSLDKKHNWDLIQIGLVGEKDNIGQRIYDSQGISTSIRSQGGGQGAKTGLYAIPVLTPDRQEKRQNGRRFKEDGDESFTLTGQDIHRISDGISVRRLTPIECERLQGFPQYESLINFNIHNNICQLDVQKSYVNAESQNLKLLSVVGNVEKEGTNKNAQSVKQNLKQEVNKPAQENVLINCEEERVEIHNQEKSLNYVNFVESQISYLHQIKKEDFVQMIVGINSICEKIINLGKEGLLQNEQSLIQVENGKISVKLSGKEMMQLVKDVKNDSTILKEHLKYITSSHLNIGSLDSNWIISFSYVISAIIGCILQETQINNSLNLRIKSRFGYTYGFSDTQRYKMMGNAVTTNVVKAISEKILKGIFE